MKKNEKLVISGNEFYILDLDCLEKKKNENTQINMATKKKNQIKKKSSK